MEKIIVPENVLILERFDFAKCLLRSLNLRDCDSPV
jgi:hypothetical protein